MTNIVFINQAAGYLMKDVINVFCEKFDKVALIAGSVSETGSGLNSKVAVKKICSYNKNNAWYRLFTWLYATLQVIILVNVKFRKSHIFITSNPPTLAFLPIFCRNRYSVLIYDVYPDGLIAGKFISENSLIFRLWKRQNKRFFKNALNIFTLTDSMAETISAYVDRASVKVIDPWSIFSNHSAILINENKFLEEYELENDFVVMYSGNIGLGHNVEILVEVARLLEHEQNIKFVIIGEGWNKKLVQKKITDYNLSNCILLPLQSSGMLIHSLSAANISMVSVSVEGSKVCAPSKIYNLINIGIPVLCISDEDTGLSHLVNTNLIGRTFKTSETSEIAQFILKLKKNPAISEDFKLRLRNCRIQYHKSNALNYLTDFKE